MNVFVVMGNDYPEAVFDTKEAADAYCEAQKHTPEAEAHRKTYGGYRIHWRPYEFPLQRAKPNGFATPHTVYDIPT